MGKVLGVTDATSGASTSHALVVAVDLASGTLAGTAQLMVGHPFDTVKVKLQSQGATSAAAQFKGPVEATLSTLRSEGVRGLYKGLAPPLAAVALFNAVLFSSRGQMEALLAHADGSPLTTFDRLLVATGASAAVTLVATPTELLKCRLQAQGSLEAARARLLAAGVDPGKAVLYRGPLDVARHVLAQQGVTGLFRGLVPTLVREVLGNAAMFGVYDLIKDNMAASRGLSTNQLSKSDFMVAGGLGGTAFWLAAYPVDVIKSKIQVDSYETPRYRGMLDCGRQVIAADGIRGLWRGFGPALARSFPANAACFAVYEASSDRIGRLLGTRQQ